jgi:hypothetical protein
MLPSLPKLAELDSRGRRVLLRALAGASRRTRAQPTGNHPDHIGDDAMTKARCPVCQAEKEHQLREKHGEDADAHIEKSRRLSANLAFLHKCVEVLERRKAADARDAEIETALEKWPSAIKHVAERTGYSIAAVNRVAKRMKDGAATGPQQRAACVLRFDACARRDLDQATLDAPVKELADSSQGLLILLVLSQDAIEHGHNV